MLEMGEVHEYESEQKFIDDTKQHFGTFHQIDSEEQFIREFIPHQDLDMLVYKPFIARNADGDRRVVIISWKMEADADIEKRLQEYARNLPVIKWFICKWPRAEGGVRIGDLKLKNTHHRFLVIWYA